MSQSETTIGTPIGDPQQTIDTPIGDPQQTPNKSWLQRMSQSANGGDDTRVFTLKFDEVENTCYSNPFNTKESNCYGYDRDRFEKIETFEKELINKVRRYVNFHKIKLPNKYNRLNDDWNCKRLSLLSLDKYVISGDVNKEVVVEGKIDSPFWSDWTHERVKANVADIKDKTTMDGKVRIDFHFDFSKLKSLKSPGRSGGTRRNRRRRIVSRRLKKSHRSVGTRKNRRVYRK